MKCSQQLAENLKSLQEIKNCLLLMQMEKLDTKLSQIGASKNSRQTIGNILIVISSN